MRSRKNQILTGIKGADTQISAPFSCSYAVGEKSYGVFRVPSGTFLPMSELRGGESRVLFENTAKVEAVGVAEDLRTFPYAQLIPRQKLLGSFDAQLGYVFYRCHARISRKTADKVVL